MSATKQKASLIFYAHDFKHHSQIAALAERIDVSKEVKAVVLEPKAGQPFMQLIEETFEAYDVTSIIIVYTAACVSDQQLDQFIRMLHSLTVPNRIRFIQLLVGIEGSQLPIMQRQIQWVDCSGDWDFDMILRGVL